MELEKNFYGMALTQFTLGFIYHHFAEEFSDDHMGETYPEYKKEENKKCLAKAKDFYHKACLNFSKVKHLMGAYLSKKHETELIEMTINDDLENMEANILE